MKNVKEELSVIGERIKELRKALRLTQAAFAERIGIRQNSVAVIEIGKNTPSDQTIAFICREFRVNEAWLRNGAGEMFVPSPASIVDELAEEYHLGPEARAMVEKFITLDPAAQLAVFDYMCAVVDELRGRETNREERLRDELERQLAKEKKGTEKSEA
jgi:transcriptional regulator with XRE-family HTH domain